MKWKAFVVLLGVFFLGVGGGIVLDRVAFHRDGDRGRHKPPMGRILHRLTKTLDLSKAQQQDVRAILMSTRTELKSTHQQMRQRVDDILKTSETRVQQVLEPAQRKAFDKLMAKHRKRRKHQHRHFRKWDAHPD